VPVVVARTHARDAAACAAATGTGAESATGPTTVSLLTSWSLRLTTLRRRREQLIGALVLFGGRTMLDSAVGKGRRAPLDPPLTAEARAALITRWHASVEERGLQVPSVDEALWSAAADTATTMTTCKGPLGSLASRSWNFGDSLGSVGDVVGAMGAHVAATAAAREAAGFPIRGAADVGVAFAAQPAAEEEQSRTLKLYLLACAAKSEEERERALNQIRS
jgi:hypothetical protein